MVLARLLALDSGTTLSFPFYRGEDREKVKVSLLCLHEEQVAKLIHEPKLYLTQSTYSIKSLWQKRRIGFCYQGLGDDGW